jgi:DNA (cytosine-5)-methyltransferase 1
MNFSPRVVFPAWKSPPKHEVFIDLTSDSEDDEDVKSLTSEMQSISGPSGSAAIDEMVLGQFAQSSPAFPRAMDQQAPRQAVRASPFLPQWCINGVKYQAGMSVKLNDGSFLRIQQIDPIGHDVLFTGRRLFRATHSEVKMYLPKQENELIWVTQLMESVGIHQIKQICDIRFTNRRTDFAAPPPQLTCRLKLTIRQQGIIILPGQHPLTADQTAIEYLNYHESDKGFGMTSIELRDEWRGRGRTAFFGEGRTSPSSAQDMDHKADDVIDLTGIVTGESQTYTFGDAYCGGGGVSCGAKQAGLDIKWAVDSCRHVVDTYQRNFEGVEIEHAQFFDFLTNDPDWMRVDICHCSPPCQTFSPAHTVNCNRDDDNSACIFSAGSLCRTAKPRILTMEETSGLPERWADVFHRVLLDMVEIGYSLRWAVLRCDDYGVPQDRKRLVVIAAG